MMNKYRLAAIIACCYLIIGVFRIYGVAQLSHYLLGDGTPFFLTDKELFSRGVSLAISTVVVFGVALFFTSRLRQGEENYRILFNESSDPLALFDLQTSHYVKANKKFLNALGYSRNSITKILVPGEIPVRETAERLLKESNTSILQVGTWALNINQTEVLWEVSVSITRWNGKTTGLLTLHDVTAHAHYEKQLKNVNHELEQKVELRTRELAYMNNELLTSNEELNATNDSLRDANEQLSVLHAQLQFKTEQLLQQSEEKLNRILSSINEVVWAGYVLSDNSIQVEFINPAIETLTGSTVEQILQNRVTEEYQLPGVSAFLKSQKKYVPGSYSFEAEQLITSLTGDKKWVLSRNWIRVNENKTIDIDGVMTDVTDRKTAELEVSNQQQMLQNLIDNLPSMVMLIDEDNIIRFVNDSFLDPKVDNQCPKNYIGSPFEKYVQEVNNNTGDTAWVRRFITTEKIWVDYDGVLPDGRQYYMRWMRVPSTNGSYIHIGYDITQLRGLMSDLEKHSEMMQTLIDNLPLKILFMDENSVIKYINSGFVSVHPQMFIGKKVEELINTGFTGEASRRAVWTMLEKKGEWIDMQLVTTSGEELYDSWIAIPLSNGSCLAIGQDIRVRKRAEEEKNKLMEQLIVQNNELMQFSYIASHNLRGPVASMLGLINLLNYQSASVYIADILEGLQISVQKLDSVIKDMNHILEMRNTIAYSNEQVDIRSLVQETVDYFKNEISELGVQVSVEIQTEKIYTIKNYLHNILNNLVSNALKFHDPGRVPQVEIKVTCDARNIQMSVTDNGKGIDINRFRDKLFLLYQRFDTEVNGKGLGLFLSKTQAEAIGGKITVKSEPGKGSTFTLILPVNKDSSAGA